MKANFICLADINDSPCVTAKKQTLQQHKIGNVGDDRIIVLKKEIESWYLAGLGDTCCGKLGIPSCDATDSIDKEQFETLISRSGHTPKMNCMSEILKNFDMMTATQKNQSFNYFHRKYLQ